MFNKRFKIKYILIFIGILSMFIAVQNTMPAIAANSTNSFFDFFTANNSYLDGRYRAYEIGGKWGIYEESTQDIITLPVYDNIKVLDSTRSNFAVLQNGYWGIVKRDGDILTPPIWEDIFSLGYYAYAVRKNGLYGWIDNISGNIIQRPVYTSVNAIDMFLICVGKNNLYGIVNINKGTVVKRIEYDRQFVGLYSNAYWILYKNGKYYVMDMLDVPITKTGYSEIKSITRNAVFIKENQKLGLVRMRDGKEIAKPVYDKIEDMSQPGFYKVKQNGKWGAVDYDGNLIFECKYGPLEINRLVKNYPDNEKYKDICDYNFYYAEYLKVYYFLEHLYINGADVRSALRKLLSNENKSDELKTKANELINKYNIDRSKI